MVVAVLAAIFHTYGYSLIFKSRSTPGGLEIISAHFASQPQTEFSVSNLIKYFSFFIIFVTTVFQFVFIKRGAEKKNIAGYFEFISKEGGFLATIVYILVSSMLMSKLFPRGQIILCKIYSLNEESRFQALNILKDHSPFYYNIRQKKNQEEKTIYIASCYISR